MSNYLFFWLLLDFTGVGCPAPPPCLGESSAGLVRQVELAYQPPLSWWMPLNCQMQKKLVLNPFWLIYLIIKKDRIMLVTGVYIVQGGEISRWCFCSLVLVVNFLTKVLFTSYSEFFVNVDQSFWLAEVFSWCSVISI